MEKNLIVITSVLFAVLLLYHAGARRRILGLSIVLVLLTILLLQFFLKRPAIPSKQDNTLVLTSVTTSKEPFIRSYTVHVKAEIDPERGKLALLDNDYDAGAYGFTLQTNGTYLVQWNTISAANGLHILRIAFYTPFNKIIYGPKRTEYVTNIIRLDPDNSFGTQARIYGTLIMSNANYKIEIYDTSNNLLKTIIGHTDKGVVDEVWDLKMTNGQAWAGKELEGKIYITPTVTDTNGMVRSNAPTVLISYP